MPSHPEPLLKSRFKFSKKIKKKKKNANFYFFPEIFKKKGKFAFFRKKQLFYKKMGFFRKFSFFRKFCEIIGYFAKKLNEGCFLARPECFLQ